MEKTVIDYYMNLPSTLFIYLKCQRKEMLATNSQRPMRFIILQKITAATVLINVATIAGPTIAVGFTLPYWLR